MKAVQLAEVVRNDALVSSIVDKKHVQISHKGEKGWQLYKAHLKEGDMNKGIQLAEITPTFGEGGSFSGEVGISFRLGHKKMLFHASGHSPQVEWPNNLTAVQRKAFERQDPKTCLSLRMWPLEDRANIIHGEVRNISTGGLQVSIRNKGEELADCYSCAINADHCIVADAIVRKVDPVENERLLVGMQFVGLELDRSLIQIRRLIKLVSKLSRRRQPPRRARLPLPWQESFT
jgi:hypothetical protein